MKTTFVSTAAITNFARQSLMQMQGEASRLNVELTTGRHADVGLALGHKTGQTVSLRSQFDSLSQFLDTNALVMGRLETTQISLGAIADRAESFVNIALAGRDGWAGDHVIVEEGRDALSFLLSQLNSSINGEYVFGGINNDTPPAADYFAMPASAAKASVDAAFFAEFGMTQNDANVANITPAAMQTFLDGAFAALFDPAGWSTDWSSASDTNLTSRIATDTLVQSGTNANIEPFRALAMAFTMVTDLGTELLNDNALRVVADKAAELAGRSIQQLALEQGDIGAVQQRIERTDQITSRQLNILNSDIVSLETVDAFETSTRMNQLISRIEISYAVTGRLQQLSLVRFL